MKPLGNLYSLLLHLNPYEFTALSVVLGYVFSDGLDSNQIQSMGNFFESIGQTMLTIGMQQQTLRGNASPNGSTDTDTDTANYQEAVNLLKNKIQNIEEIIKNLQNLTL